MRGYDLVAPCPHCGRANDAHLAMGLGGEPKHGDVSLCIVCRLFGIFDNTPLGLTLRKPTPDEQNRLNEDEALQQLLVTLMYL